MGAGAFLSSRQTAEMGCAVDRIFFVIGISVRRDRVGGP